MQPPTNTASRRNKRLLRPRPAGRSSRRSCRAASLAARQVARARRSGGRSRCSSRASKRRGREQLDARRRQLDRQRQPIEAARRSPPRRRVLVGQVEVRAGRRARAATKSATAACSLPARPTGGSRSRSGRASGGTVNSCSPRDTQRDAAGDQHLQPRAGRQQVRQSGAAAEHLLEVVEHQQELLVAQEGRQTLGAAAGRRRRARRAPARSVGGTRSGSPIGARATKQTPSAKSARAARPRPARARRVLPTPPGPVSVTSRVSPARSATRRASSSARPTKELSVKGKLWRRGGAGRDAGSSSCGVAVGGASPTAPSAWSAARCASLMPGRARDVHAGIRAGRLPGLHTGAGVHIPQAHRAIPGSCSPGSARSGSNPAHRSYPLWPRSVCSTVPVLTSRSTRATWSLLCARRSPTRAKGDHSATGADVLPAIAAASRRDLPQADRIVVAGRGDAIAPRAERPPRRGAPYGRVSTWSYLRHCSTLHSRAV